MGCGMSLKPSSPSASRSLSSSARQNVKRKVTENKDKKPIQGIKDVKSNMVGMTCPISLAQHVVPYGGAQGGYPGNAFHQAGYPGNSAPQGGFTGGFANSGAQGQIGQQQQIDSRTLQWFNAVDTDRSGHIDAKDLQKVLVNGDWSNFSEEACRMMISMYDRDNSGSIDLNEFQDLFGAINQWKAVFQSCDKGKSGTIEQDELIQAFQEMGYRFAPAFAQNVMAKFGNRNKRLSLDNFIIVHVQIKRLTDAFRQRDRSMQGQATFQYEEFVGIAMGIYQ